MGKVGIGGDFITLARVMRTQGRRGEVAIELHSNIPDRFKPGLRLFALAPDDTRRELHIEEVWPHKGHLVLKVAGVDSISEAEVLVGSELQVPLSERASLDAGWNYVSDLVGCVVFDRDREIGKIEKVEFGAGEAPLMIVGRESKRYEIPYAEAYLTSVDLERKQLVMHLPDGMLEVNSPLTAEEKQQQARSGKKRA